METIHLVDLLYNNSLAFEKDDALTLAFVWSIETPFVLDKILKSTVRVMWNRENVSLELVCGSAIGVLMGIVIWFTLFRHIFDVQSNYEDMNQDMSRLSG